MPIINDNLEEYFKINFKKKFYLNATNKHDYELTSATRLLEKRRETIEIENGLQLQKQDFASKMESLVGRREELAKRQKNLRNKKIKFEKYLKENDAKRLRAEKKKSEEKKLKEAKQKMIINYKKVLNDLLIEKSNQLKQMELNILYQKYFESILETETEFLEPNDVISRYDTLKATNTDLIHKLRVTQDKIEETQITFTRNSEEQNNIILNYNNDIARLQSKLEECQQKTAKWQNEWDKILNTATEKSLLLGQTKMATNNLFNLVRLNLDNRIRYTSDTTAQLDKIQQFIVGSSYLTILCQELQ
ncbi:coiled-coil domain-containing protein 42 [Anaeromyces robustus]|uniref:Coiled-coil domain-containing protein 42 n=1 Tax=Anaeromyces robustus TaxID=1754192 RepID=A0A1Y1VVT0_9FUNG|nr:coiled-coil domain-containing protein 42 [Anaeromyces robustus]|eukprot:ORX65391.1 coiled-coil domain-containing protein 42 [Anaeromyces robustus]